MNLNYYRIKFWFQSGDYADRFMVMAAHTAADAITQFSVLRPHNRIVAVWPVAREEISPSELCDPSDS